jgi:C_GCAxxG_C_C family probable redox protein
MKGNKGTSEMAIDYRLLDEILSEYGSATGPNCAECMFLYGVKGFGLDVPSDMLKIATPFGGGIATCEDTCGALTGGMMVIGMKYGRSNLDGNKRYTYKIARKYCEWFKNEIGSTNCFQLNHGEYNSQAHRERCGTYIRKALEYIDNLFNEVGPSENKL